MRAVAVLAVILFHLDLGVFSGGFVGVDVFFVISGYLISQRIVNGYENGGFSYTRFYVRRIRRLFPALASTIIGTLLAGAVFLSPDSLSSLSWSSISAILSVANIHFFLEAGYWDVESWTKPLLHTWSLGVEEQFYLVWPLIIVGLLALTKRFALLMLVVLTLASLLVTAIYTPHNPDATFYLTPFRMYEFGIGALCVWFDRVPWNTGVLSKYCRSALFLLGFLMIIGATFMVENNDAFPGWIALIPALGTAFVILARNPAVLGLLLSNPVSRYIGLISYSLYLVHWPVMVFLMPETGHFAGDSLLLVLSCIFFLSVLQYHCVERPFRYPKPSSRTGIRHATPTFALTGAVMFLVTASALVIALSGGLPGRYTGDIERFASLTKRDTHLERRQNMRKICGDHRNGTVCGKISNGSINVLVVGDSHTADGLNMLVTAYPDVNYLYAGEGGCPLFANRTTHLESVSAECAVYNKLRLRDIENILPGLDFIALSQRVRLEHTEATLNTLDWFAERGVEVIVFGAGPQFKKHVVPSIVERGTMLGIDEALHAESVTNHYAADDILELHVAGLGGVYIRKRGFFCPQNVCQVVLSNGEPLMFDKSHLSLDASKAFGMYLSTAYRDLLGPAS